MEQQVTQLTIITGMSGAGKTVAIQSLEDLGYYCVDNLPPVLIPKFIELLEQSTKPNHKLALVLDLRGREFFDTVLNELTKLEQQDQYDCQILYLDASDDALIHRYKQTRRKHPLSPEGSLSEGIRQERLLLQELKGKAMQVIDTSQLKPGQLRERIMQRFSAGNTNQLTLNIMSFGFKYGIPVDADLVLDVRFLNNPYYVTELRSQTGLDKPVYDYVLSFNETQAFIRKLEDLLDFLLPLYKKEGKSQLVIAIGCTGGKHRSVTLVEYLTRKYCDSFDAWANHRDIEKDKAMYQAI